MNICLINPPRLLQKYLETLKSTPPLGLAYIAGTLQRLGHNITVIDAMAEDPHNTFPFSEDIVVNGLSYENIIKRIPKDTQLIGHHFMFSNNWLLFRQLTDVLGEAFPGVLQVAGGEHVTAVPHLCLSQAKHLDVCVLGEGEETIEDLIKAIELGQGFSGVNGIMYREKNGEIVTTAPRTRIRKLDEIAPPGWNLFPMELYKEHKMSYGVINDGESTLPVLATRGCPYECTFCSSPNMWGTRYNMRKASEVADEIQYLSKTYGIKNFDFYDLTAIINKHWIIEFSKELINRKLNITWQIPGGTRSEVIDFEVATYLYNSGCRNITYAPESGSERMLAVIKKKVAIPNMLKSMSQSYKAGLNIKLNMIIGFPDDTHLDIWKTAWFLVKCSWYGAHDMYPAVFSPYPGSELFERLRNEKQVDPTNDQYFINLVFLDTFSKTVIYCKGISRRSIYLYQMLLFVVFYGSNYLFRPWRPFVSIKNVLTGTLESKAEYQARSWLERIVKLQSKPAKVQRNMEVEV